MNDIWYVGQGFWMVYVADPLVINDFKTIPALQLITAYYSRGKQVAEQFSFFQGEDLRPGFCLLHYVCSKASFDYTCVLQLGKKHPGLAYREYYRYNAYQLELSDLFNTFEPKRNR